MQNKLYAVHVLHFPETTKYVVTSNRKRACQLYLKNQGKYCSNLITEKIDCTILNHKEGVV